MRGFIWGGGSFHYSLVEMNNTANCAKMTQQNEDGDE